MKKTALHVGCANQTLATAPKYFQTGDWKEIRYDIDESVKPDIVGTITDLKAIQSGTMDAVYSSHNLEHVFPHEVNTVLKEFRRVLRPDGACIVAVPDLLQVCELVVADRLEEPAYQSGMGPISPLDMLYGHIASVKSGKHYMAHKTGFTPKSLGQAFMNAGFASAVYTAAGFALTMIAYPTKPANARIKEDEKLVFGVG